LETILIIAAIIVIGGWFYEQGKHVGSKKGFGVGRDRERRRRR
jgi:hypothetical protein